MIEFPTLKVMRDQVARQIGDNSAGRATKIDEWLNIHYSEACRQKPWPQLVRTSEEEMNFTDGAAYVYLPKEVEQLYFVMAANQEPAVQLGIESLIRNGGNSYRIPGSTYGYAEAGEFGRRRDFHTAAERIALSTSGSVAVAAVVHGTATSKAPVASAQEKQEQVTISPSTGGTTVGSFADLFSVGVAALADGAVITAQGATSGLTYATIGEGESTARYKRIRLMNPDTGGNLVTCVWKKRPFKLISDNQAIEIPAGPWLVESCIATMMVNQREYNSAAIYHQARAKEGLDNSFHANEQTDKIILGQPMGMHRGKRIIIVGP